MKDTKIVKVLIVKVKFINIFKEINKFCDLCELRVFTVFTKLTNFAKTLFILDDKRLVIKSKVKIKVIYL